MNDDTGISIGCPSTWLTTIHQRYSVTISLEMKRTGNADDPGTDYEDIAGVGANVIGGYRY